VLGLGALPLDDLADLAADVRHHRQQRPVGRPQLAAEEFEDGDRLAPHHDRERHGRVQPRAPGERRAREGLVGREVFDPEGLAAPPHAAGQPRVAAPERPPPRRAHELAPVPAVRAPGLDEAQRRRLAVARPHEPHLPTQRLAHGAQDARHGLLEIPRLGERARHLVLRRQARRRRAQLLQLLLRERH